MADDPNNTKAAFDETWVSATEAGEYLTQSNDGDWNRALTIIQEAIIGGCPALLEWDHGGQKNHAAPAPELALKFWSSPDRLRWVNALNPSMQRKNFSDRPWPWELRAYLSLSDLWELRHIEGLPATPRVFLHRAEAIKWGLLPDKQLNDPVVGIQASAHTQNAPEQPEAPLPAAAADAPLKPIEPAATEQAPVEPLPAPEAAPRLDEPTSDAEPPPEEAEQQRPLLLLSDEPQFEGPRKWRPEDVKDWFKEIRRNHPQRPDEHKTEWAQRLHGHMKEDFENPPPWSDAEALRRRLNDPNYD